MIKVKNGHIKVSGSEKEVLADITVALFILRTHFEKKDLQIVLDKVDEKYRMTGTELC